MKFQYLAVIFVIIMLPIILVMSFYVQTQTDVMKRQGEYRTYLSDATHDAIKAFQINTTNSYYSSVSDSKIRDIEAAVNAFYNSLMANLNYSKSELQAYVPAIVFTLYDGYYIYGKRYNVYPKEDVKINESGELTEMNIVRDEGNNEVEEIVDPDLYEYGLKPFVYYSCQYQKGSDNFIVNYTLDNFISIYGYITCENEETGVRERQYINKSGHLIQIDPNKDFEGDYKGIKIEKDNKENLTEYLEFSSPNTRFSDREYRYVVHQNQKVYINENVSEEDADRYFWYDQGVAHPIQGVNTREAIKKTVEEVNSSYEYYEEAYEFSKWVYENLRDIKQADIRTVVRKSDGTIEVTSGGENLDFNAGEEKIFDTSKDPEDTASTFNQHRIAVIKNAIETNLIAAINSYNSNASSFSYALPELSAEDLEKVVNNVCMISFMQGMPIGTKYFNDYVVIPNDKNNEFVDNDALYLLTYDETKKEGKYHLANCPYLVENISSNPNLIVGGYINTAFQRQTVEQTIDEEKTTSYYYRHVYDIDSPNRVYVPYTPCYQCLVNTSGRYDLDDDIIHNHTGRIIKDGESYDISILRQKYFSIFGREKNNLYKTNR